MSCALLIGINIMCGKINVLITALFFAITAGPLPESRELGLISAFAAKRNGALAQTACGSLSVSMWEDLNAKVEIESWSCQAFQGYGNWKVHASQGEQEPYSHQKGAKADATVAADDRSRRNQCQGT